MNVGLKKNFRKIWRYRKNNFIFAPQTKRKTIIMHRKTNQIDLAYQFSPLVGIAGSGACIAVSLS